MGGTTHCQPATKPYCHAVATGLIWKTLAVATIAAGGVWLLTVATFRPLVTATIGEDGEIVYVDNRWFCSGGATTPYTVDGVRVEPTLQPRCHGGPIPADALRPSPVPAVATFLLVGSLCLVVVGFMLSYHAAGPDHPPA